MKYSLINTETKGPRKLVLLAIMVYLLHGFLSRTFHLPGYFCYAVEIFSLLIWFCHPFRLTNTKLRFTWKIFMAILVFAGIGAILNHVFFMNVLMGFRSLFMPMALFFGAAAYLTIQDYHRIFDLLYKFQWLNLLCSFVQFAVFGLTSDLNNGALTGGAEQNFFCAALMAYYFYAYVKKRVDWKKLVFVFASSFFIAVVQDEKFIFVAAMIIGFYYVVSQKLSFRNVIIALAFLGGFVFAISHLNEGQKEVFGSAENALAYSQKAGAGYGYPRVGSSAQIAEDFFDTPVEYLLGIGLGKSTETKAPGVDVSFASQYGHLTYFLFTFQDVFLQTGWIGIILFVGFFVSIYLYNRKWRKRVAGRYKWLYDVACAISLISIVIIWYNCTQRVYYAVLPYIILGIGPCLTNNLYRLKNEQ